MLVCIIEQKRKKYVYEDYYLYDKFLIKKKTYLK